MVETGRRDKVISQRKAAEKMGVSDRWVRRLLRRMKRKGTAWWCMGCGDELRIGRSEPTPRALAMEILKQPDWHDFGPTFASEQLAKRHQIQVSKETLRGWMIGAGLWQPGSA